MEDCVGVVHLTIKSMKEFISAILFFSVFTASAQKPGSPPSMEERIKKTKEIISSEIQLNSTQLKITIEAFSNFFTQVDQLLKGETPPPNPIQLKQLEAIESERDQKIISVLNENQVKRYKEIILKLRPPKPGQGNQQGPLHRNNNNY